MITYSIQTGTKINKRKPIVQVTGVVPIPWTVSNKTDEKMQHRGSKYDLGFAFRLKIDSYAIQSVKLMLCGT